MAMDVNNAIYSNMTQVAHSDRINTLLCIVIPISLFALLCAAFNLFSVYIILNSKKLQRPSNYPVISVLIGATLQSLLSVPTFIFKQVNEIYSHPDASWFCEFYLVPYYFCGHIMKMSLLIVSVDRLVAVKYPYRYPEIITRKLITIVLLFTWFLVLTIDMIPFFSSNKMGVDADCKYISSQVWRMINFLLFDTLTFITITVNYAIIWKAAIAIAHRDVSIKKRMRKHKENGEECKDDSPSSSDAENNSEEMDDSSIVFDESVELGEWDENEEVTSTTYKRQKSTDSLDKYKKRFSNASSIIRYTWDTKATKTSALLLLVYLISWGPLDILYAIDIFFTRSSMLKTKVPKVYFAAKIMSFFSSIFMPLVYCWRTKEFGRETLRLLCRERYRKKWAKSFFREARATVIAQYSALSIDRKAKYHQVK